jgi:hypothetical protein
MGDRTHHLENKKLKHLLLSHYAPPPSLETKKTHQSSNTTQFCIIFLKTPGKEHRELESPIKNDHRCINLTTET